MAVEMKTANREKRIQASHALEVRSVRCGYGDRCVLEDVSFTVDSGEVLLVLGPNGIGKTTLFRTILGFLPAMGGEVRVNGEDISALPRKRIAQSIAYVPQSHESAFGFTVREMVLMGRTPGLQGISSPGGADERIVDEILENLGMLGLAERDCTTLSGGEMQMVLVARALAQEPLILVMDEPCASLDLGNQLIILERMRALAARGIAVVATSHDPNHALQLRSKVACLSRQGRMALKQSDDVLDPALLSELYGIAVGVGQVKDAQGREGQACALLMDEGASGGREWLAKR